MNSYNSDQKREIIMERYINPKLKKTLKPTERHIYHHSSSCVDELFIFKDSYEKYVFFGKGCAIFIASTDIFLELLNEGKEFDKLANTYSNLINQNNLGDDDFSFLQDLVIFGQVKKHFNRVECALMVIKCLEKRMMVI